MILGTIKSYTAGQGVTILIDGEDTPTTKEYKFLSGYSPIVNDRVLIEEISGTYVVLGKITDSSTSSDVSYTLESGTTKNIVKLVNGAGEDVSSVTVNNVASADYASRSSTATNATSATRATDSENTNHIINQNFPYSTNARIQFRTTGQYGTYSLEYRLTGGSWIKIV